MSTRVPVAPCTEPDCPFLTRHSDGRCPLHRPVTTTAEKEITR